MKKLNKYTDIKKTDIQTTEPQKPSRRIETIDIFRGFSMLYVVFIHCLFWTGFFPTPEGAIIKSLFLIEMPLFFFIMGASSIFSNTSNLLYFYYSKLQRILIPYFIYAFIAIMFLYFFSAKITGTPFSSSFVDVLFSWLIPLDSQLSSLPYLTYALWFIPIYCCVNLILPLLKNYFQSTSSLLLKTIPLLIFMLIVLAVSPFVGEDKDISYYFINTMFYGFWAYLGFFFLSYLKNKSFLKKFIYVLPIIFIALTVIWGLLTFFNYSLDMQGNKFPPNSIFLFYTILILSVFYLFLSPLEKTIQFIKKFKPIGWLFTEYEKSCYTIFLFHPFSFLIADFVVMNLSLKEHLMANSWLGLFLYLLMTIPLSALFGKVFSKIEKIKF